MSLRITSRLRSIICIIMANSFNQNSNGANTSQELNKYELNVKYKLQLQKYINSYNKEFYNDSKSISAHDIERISAYLGRHEFIIHKYLSPEFQFLTIKAQNLFPNVRAGKIACIDGRESRVIQDGKVFSRWSVPAGIPVLIYRNWKKHLASGRLRNAILSVAKQKGEILELMKIHTSQSAPMDRGCAALKRLLMLENDGKLPDNANLVETGIKLLQERKAVIRELFNMVRREVRLPTLKKVTILGVSDTDTLGLTFMGNDEERPLNTVELAKLLFPNFREYLADRYGKKYREIGIFKEKFMNPENIIDFEEMNFNIALTLMEYKPFVNAMNHYVKNSSLHLLTENQMRCYFYTAARNLANQYLLAFYLNVGHPNHPFSKHAEMYGSISFDGIHIGQLDPGIQALKASPSSEEDAIEQAEIQYSVLHGNNPEKPHIFFVVTAVPQISIHDEKALIGYRGTNYNFLNILLGNKKMADLVKNQELLLVPVLLNETTREIIEIPNQMM